MKFKHILPYCREVLGLHYRDMLAPAPLTADFYLSAGLNCTPALQLRRHSLRIHSSPLDWMMGYGFEHAAELYRTGFRDFFAEIREHPPTGNKNRVIEDAGNGMLAIHHFPLSTPLEQGHREFLERSRKRFETTDRFLRESESVVVASKSGEPPENILRFLTELKRKYKAGFTQINVRVGPGQSLAVFKADAGVVLLDYSVDDRSILEKRGFKDKAHRGNDYEWGRILKRCRRTSKFAPPEKMAGRSYD